MRVDEAQHPQQEKTGASLPRFLVLVRTQDSEGRGYHLALSTDDHAEALRTWRSVNQRRTYQDRPVADSSLADRQETDVDGGSVECPHQCGDVPTRLAPGGRFIAQHATSEGRWCPASYEPVCVARVTKETRYLVWCSVSYYEGIPESSTTRHVLETDDLGEAVAAWRRTEEAGEFAGRVLHFARIEDRAKSHGSQWQKCPEGCGDQRVWTYAGRVPFWDRHEPDPESWAHCPASYRPTVQTATLDTWLHGVQG